jgi:hypothetical protein
MFSAGKWSLSVTLARSLTLSLFLSLSLFSSLSLSSLSLFISVFSLSPFFYFLSFLFLSSLSLFLSFLSLFPLFLFPLLIFFFLSFLSLSFCFKVYPHLWHREDGGNLIHYKLETKSTTVMNRDVYNCLSRSKRGL